MKAAKTLIEIWEERDRQDARFGEQNHPDGTGHPADVVNADWARRTCDVAFGAGQGTWKDILAEEFYEALAETDPAKLRTELLQVAAVAAAWVEAIDRRLARAKDVEHAVCPECRLPVGGLDKCGWCVPVVEVAK